MAAPAPVGCPPFVPTRESGYVVTKSFQSIRQLMTRVLGSAKSAGEPESAHEYSTLGLEPAEPAGPSLVVADDVHEPNVTVLVEAPLMDSEPEEPGATCPADMEMQTADTMQLHPVHAEPAGESANEDSDPQESTIEIEAEPVTRHEDVTPEDDEEINSPLESPFSGVPEMNDTSSQQIAQPEIQDQFGDSLLELGDFHDAAAANVEDSILDLDGKTTASVLEPPPAARIAEPSARMTESDFAFESAAVAHRPEVEVVPALIETEEWALVPEATVEDAFEAGEEVQAKSIAAPINLSDLSPEVIDEIARRAVAQLSDKVVREIAWEVVPDLAELLIKQRLDEQKD